VGKTFEKHTIGRVTRKWVDIIITNLWRKPSCSVARYLYRSRKIFCEDVRWIVEAQDCVQWQPLVMSVLWP